MGDGDIAVFQSYICHLAPLRDDNLRDPESSLHDGCASAGHPDRGPERDARSNARRCVWWHLVANTLF